MEIFESYNVIQFEEGPARVCKIWVGGEEMRRAESDSPTVTVYFSASDLDMLRNPGAHPLYGSERE